MNNDEVIVADLSGEAPGVYPSLSARELLNATFPPRERLLKPWLLANTVTMIHALRGVGKTNTTLALSVALATGTEAMGWAAPKAVRVLYVDGEMACAEMQDRLRGFLPGAGIQDVNEVDDQRLRFLLAERFPRGLPDLPP